MADQSVDVGGDVGGQIQTATSGEGQTVDVAGQLARVLAMRQTDQLKHALSGIHEEFLELPAIRTMATFDELGSLTPDAMTQLGKLKADKPHWFRATAQPVAQPVATASTATAPAAVATVAQPQLPTLPTPQGAGGFLNLAEMRAAMTDPARKNDTVWRQRVADSWAHHKGQVQ